MKTKKEKKREAIIRAAAGVFARHGYFGTRMTEVAKSAGIGKGTVYEYFRSKEDLFFAVFQWYNARAESAARIGIHRLGASAGERLSAMNDAIMDSWPDLRDGYSLVMEFWSAASTAPARRRFRASFREIYRNYRAVVSALIRDGIRSGEFRPNVDADAVAAALVGAWDALMLQAWFEEDFDPAAASQGFFQALLLGLLRTKAREKEELPK
jgi:AcrR family transcriptional regulator